MTDHKTKGTSINYKISLWFSCSSQSPKKERRRAGGLHEAAAQICSLLFRTKLDVYFYIFLHMFSFFPLCFKCWSALFSPSCLSFSLFLVVPVITLRAKSYFHILDCTQFWQRNLTPFSDIFLRSKRKYTFENNTHSFHWNRENYFLIQSWFASQILQPEFGIFTQNYNEKSHHCSVLPFFMKISKFHNSW